MGKRACEMSAKIVIKHRRRGPNHHMGAIEIPLTNGGRVSCEGVGWTPWDAVKQAASVVNRVVTDPALAPLMPPQVQAAVMAAKTISKLAKQHPGVLKAITPSLARKSDRKLARSFTKHPAIRNVPPAALAPQASSPGGVVLNPYQATYQPPAQVPAANPYQAALDAYQASMIEEGGQAQAEQQAYEAAYGADQYEMVDEAAYDSLPEDGFEDEYGEDPAA